jgi:hypothetical protein
LEGAAAQLRIDMSKQNDLLTLHGQLLAGDLRASSKIVERTLARLVTIVEREVAGLHDQQDAEQACFDALFKYLASPGDYEPDRADLITYLAAIAKGRAMTLRRSQDRWMKRDGDYAATQELTHDLLAAAPADEAAMVAVIDWGRFGGVLVKDEGDDEIVALMKLGSATPAAVAQALGLAHDAEGHAEAARRIERIRGRARRIKERTEA